MKKFALFILITASSHATLSASEGGGCTKCQIMNNYHQTHPSAHVYYEDYLKNQGKAKETAATEELPADVKTIMSQQSISADNQTTK